MSVVRDKLRAFRYVVSESPVPWGLVRSTDVTQFVDKAPDLRLVTNLVESLAECDVGAAQDATAAVRATPTEWGQLARLLQVALQFTLHSQRVLQEELLDRHCDTTVRQVSARYVSGLEEKCAQLTHNIACVVKEREALAQDSVALHGCLAQRDFALRLLQRELAKAQQQNAQLQARVNMLEVTHAANAAALPRPAKPRWHRHVRDQAHCPLCHQCTQYQRDNLERSSLTSSSLSSSSSSADFAPPRSSSNTTIDTEDHNTKNRAALVMQGGRDVRVDELLEQTRHLLQQAHGVTHKASGLTSSPSSSL